MLAGFRPRTASLSASTASTERSPIRTASATAWSGSGFRGASSSRTIPSTTCWRAGSAYAKSVLEKIRGLPSEVKILQIMMEDTSVTCQCPECQKPIRLADGSLLTADDPAFKSTRFFIFFNKVAKLIGARRPDLRIRQYAYQQLAVQPKVPIEPNVTLVYCP